jgi:putative copper resistance protein D
VSATEPARQRRESGGRETGPPRPAAPGAGWAGWRPGPAALLAALGFGALASVLIGAWLGAAGDPGAVAARSPVGLAVAADRLALDGLGVASVGLALLPLLLGASRPTGSTGVGVGGAVGRAAGAALHRAARLGVLLAAGWAIAAVLALWLRAADAAGSPPFAVSRQLVGEYAGEVAAARGLLLTLGCALLVMVLQLTALIRPPRYPELVVGAGLLGMLPGAVTGHAASHAGHDVAVLSVALHVVAASVWVGGLLAVVLVLGGQRPLASVVLPRFSTVAGYCAATVAVTGVLSAVFRLPGPGALVTTGYGALVLAKACGLVVLLGFGWHARRQLVSRLAELAARRSDTPAPLVRWLGAELAVMAVVVGLAAALAGAAPA